MRIHFIAVGGAAMHNLALVLHDRGFEVTGSDDEIFEPSKSRLRKAGLLPRRLGWDENRISQNLDAVILGMHARADNPEVARARALGVRIYSFPEYLCEQAAGKKRIVIGGSHGKTTITGMIMHVLKATGFDFDYMVGARIPGFTRMVRLSETAPLALFEGDEYLSSAIDRRPKFLLYQPHIGLISGIAWDHINVFPSAEEYLRQFRLFISTIPGNGALIYNAEDEQLLELLSSLQNPPHLIPYRTPAFQIRGGRFYLQTGREELALRVIGRHNMQNAAAARVVCNQLGVADGDFYQALSNFRGADRRLQILLEKDSTLVYWDFAHAPSKVRASTTAVKEAAPARRLVVCLELHTFSSLNAEFLTQYNGTLSSADEAVVYFDPDTLKQKRLQPLSPQWIRQSFGTDRLTVINDTKNLSEYLCHLDWAETNLLLMSSGHFSGLDMKSLLQDCITVKGKK